MVPSSKEGGSVGGIHHDLLASHVAAAMRSGEGPAIVTGPGQGPPRQCSMRWWSGVKPWRTPHRTAWVRLVTSILR